MLGSTHLSPWYGCRQAGKHRSVFYGVTSFYSLAVLFRQVDASSFWDEYTSADSLQDRKMGVTKDDNRCIIDILVDQVGTARVVQFDL